MADKEISLEATMNVCLSIHSHQSRHSAIYSVIHSFIYLFSLSSASPLAGKEMSLEATINVNSLPDQELEKILEAVTEYENSLEAHQPLNSDNLGKN